MGECISEGAGSVYQGREVELALDQSINERCLDFTIDAQTCHEAVYLIIDWSILTIQSRTLKFWVAMEFIVGLHQQCAISMSLEPHV